MLKNNGWKISNKTGKERRCFFNNECQIIVHCSDLSMACTSSAIAVMTNSNCSFVRTICMRWSRICSSVAATSTCFTTPFAMRDNTMSNKMNEPARSQPSLSWTIIGCERLWNDLLIFLRARVKETRKLAKSFEWFLHFQNSVVYRLNSSSGRADAGVLKYGHDLKWNCVTVRVSLVLVFFR